MGITTIDELFKGPWGIVENRRQEIEAGSFGAFDRIYQEEAASNFLTIQEAAALLDCHESTARNWLGQCGARYLARGLAHLYYKLDVEKELAERVMRKAVKQAARMAK
jgi:hypothetical protein